ncbi:MAG TPA: hypothetical protein VND63_06810 [Rhodanobacteraceae bacterium]|nr:hypothetical protein [Rhodanobacteraceae bacterium]
MSSVSPTVSDRRLRSLRRAAALWLGCGLLLLALGPWPVWSETAGWTLPYWLLVAPAAQLALLLRLAPVSRRCRAGGVRGGAESPA